MTGPRALGAAESALLLVDAVDFVATTGPDLVVLVAVVEAHVVRWSSVEPGDGRTVESGAGAAESVIETSGLWGRNGAVGVGTRGIETLGVAAVGVGVKTTPHEGIGSHVALADEGVALENFDASCSSENGGEQGRMIGTWCSGEG